MKNIPDVIYDLDNLKLLALDLDINNEIDCCTLNEKILNLQQLNTLELPIILDENNINILSQLKYLIDLSVYSYNLNNLSALSKLKHLEYLDFIISEEEDYEKIKKYVPNFDRYLLQNQ